MLLRELVKERGGDDQVRFLADSCLNFLTAGELQMEGIRGENR